MATTLDEIEAKLTQATKLLGEAVAELQACKPAPKVLGRIQPAQALRFTGPTRAAGFTQFAQSVMPRTSSGKAGKAVSKKRAYYYLHLASANDPTNDKIYRPIGRAGLDEAHHIEVEARKDPNTLVERLDSREYDALINARRKMIREGASDYVGTTSAEDLTGAVQS